MNTSIIQETGRPDLMNMSDQVYCTDQECNDFWELAGGLPVARDACKKPGQAGETSSTSHTTVDPHSDPYGSGCCCALGLYNTLDPSHLSS